MVGLELTLDVKPVEVMFFISKLKHRQTQLYVNLMKVINEAKSRTREQWNPEQNGTTGLCRKVAMGTDVYHVG